MAIANNGYEKRDVNVNKIVAFTIISLLVLGAIIVGLNEYFQHYNLQLQYTRVLNKKSNELQELRAREEKMLSTYELLDYTKGIYRIPVDRAMKLMADEYYAKKQNEKK